MKKITAFIIVIVFFTLTIYSQDKQDTTKIQEKPKVTYRVGKAIVSVWEKQRQGKNGEFTARDFKVEKIFKKGDKWEYTNTFSLTELLQLRAAIDKAISEEGVKIKDENKDDDE
jgi:hypothetical protein